MTKILSYSRFTPARPPDRVADYDCCLPAIIAAKELLLPDWEIHIACDHDGYDGFWEWRDFVTLGIPARPTTDPPSLIQGMLWRLHPVLPSYEDTEIVAFRDLDSVILPSEAWALNDFCAFGSVVHGICDSVEHGVPFMGGLTALNVERLRRFHPDAAKTLAEDVTEIIYQASSPGDVWHRRGFDQTLYDNHFAPFLGKHDLIHGFSMSPGLRKRLHRHNASVLSVASQRERDSHERSIAGHIGAVVSPDNAKRLCAWYIERLRREGKRDVAESLVAIHPIT